MRFLRSFGLGLLYIIILPFILAGSCLVGVFAIFNLIFRGIALIVHFFRGEELYPEYEEDVEAQRRIEIVNNPKEEAPAPAPAPQNIYVQQNYYQGQPQQQQALPPQQPQMQNLPQYTQPPFPQGPYYNQSQLPNAPTGQIGTQEAPTQISQQPAPQIIQQPEQATAEPEPVYPAIENKGDEQ